LRIGVKVIPCFGVFLIMGIGSFLTYNFGNSGNAYACTCAPVHPPEDAIGERVIEIREMDEFYYQAVFDVEESWKGIETLARCNT
jgi:hypothetical protein